jgi:NAD/NADP transhydrogenase alpha subunit
MMGINKERLIVFTGPKEDIQRYQKLFDHLKKEGYEVMVIEGVTEIAVLRTPNWVYVGAEIDFWFRDILEEENKG